MDPDEKTLLYGSFRPVNGQSINNRSPTETLGDDSENGYGKGGPYGTTLFFFIKNVTPRHKFVK